MYIDRHMVSHQCKKILKLVAISICLFSTSASAVMYLQDNRNLHTLHDAYGTIIITDETYLPDSSFSDFNLYPNGDAFYGQESSFTTTGFDALGASRLSLGEESLRETSTFDFEFWVSEGTVLELNGMLHSNSGSQGDFNSTTLSIFDNSGLFYSITADSQVAYNMNGDASITVNFDENIVLSEGNYRIATGIDFYNTVQQYPIASAEFDITGNFIATPIPSAVWLFSSGVLAILGISRKRAII